MPLFDLTGAVQFALIKALQDNTINTGAEIAHDPMQEDCLYVCGVINTRFVAEVVAGIAKERLSK